MENNNSGGYEPSFYDENWTVLQKLIYLTKFAKGNIVDLASLEFTYTEPDASGKYTATVVGTTFTGEKTTIATVPMYVGQKGDQGATGATGAPGATGATGKDGNGVVSIHTLSHSTVGNETVNNVEVVYTDSDPQTFEVHAQNGTDGAPGAPGTPGSPGADGKSVTQVTAGTPTQSGDYTVTPLTFNVGETALAPVSVSAKNGSTTNIYLHTVLLYATPAAPTLGRFWWIDTLGVPITNLNVDSILNGQHVLCLSGWGGGIPTTYQCYFIGTNMYIEFLINDETLNAITTKVNIYAMASHSLQDSVTRL